jgi:hypothetical protein
MNSEMNDQWNPAVGIQTPLFGIERIRTYTMPCRRALRGAAAANS